MPRGSLTLCLLSLAILDASPRLPAAAPVTVLLDFEQTHSTSSVAALKRELSRILTPAHLQLDLRLKSELPPHAEFGPLVIFRMRGACSMNALPIGALSDERGALALTHSVDGELLPFAEVECDRVRASVQRVLGVGDPAAHEPALGIALARVMAHEMYHMLGHSALHTRTGLTKERLSARELTDDTPTHRAPLPTSALDSIASGNR